MRKLISSAKAVELDVSSYLDDFWKRAKEVGGNTLKLERLQTFRQPETPSWVAFNEGDYEKAIRITDESLEEDRKEAEAWPFKGQRVRVVEQPFTSYLQWELMRLHTWREFGEDVHVIDVSEVADLEKDGPLPELIALGDQVLYEILYDDTGLLQGARRIDDMEILNSVVQVFDDLFLRSCSLAAFLKECPTANLRNLKSQYLKKSPVHRMK